MKKLTLLFLLFSLCAFAGQKPDITFKITKIEKEGNNLLFKGEVKGVNLNEGGIPEYDFATLSCEIPDSADFMYPVFYEWYAVASNCYGYQGKCATKEEKEGRNIKVFKLFEGFLRPPNVWYAYGGLGEWEKKAPNTVKVEFTGKVPIEYMGKRARIHVKLRHVVGGPNAHWPGISYYHRAVEITLAPTNSVIVPPGYDPCKNLKNKMVELKIREDMLSDLKERLKLILPRIKVERESIERLKKLRESIFLSSSGYSPYKNLSDDINRVKRLSAIGPNYGLIIQETDDKVKLAHLDSKIHRQEDSLHWTEVEAESLKNKIKIIEAYKKCREMNK